MNLDIQLHTPIFKDKDIDLGKAINSSNISLKNKAKTIQTHLFLSSYFCLTFCQNHHFVGHIILTYIQQE